MVAVRKVVHRFELLVDNTDACLVRPARDTLDISCRLAHFLELIVDLLGGLYRRLGVEFGLEDQISIKERSWEFYECHKPGYETLNKTFSIT